MVAARLRAPLDAVAEAFVASLSSREVHLRPPLSSYYAVRSIEAHVLSGDVVCTQCQQFAQWEHDFNSTNFARLKWGAPPRIYGVDHAFVLERFAAEARLSPSDEDWSILRRMFEAVESLPRDARTRDLERAWQPVVRSSREERDALIEILVAAEVLKPSRTTPADVRSIPLRSNWSDQAALWRASDGVNRDRAISLFGAAFTRSE